MLAVPAFRRRITSRVWTRPPGQRAYVRRSRRDKGDEKSSNPERTEKQEREGDGLRKDGGTGGSSASKGAKPSLIEQLFPERYAAGGTHRDMVREVPRIPAQRVEERLPEPRLESQEEKLSTKANRKRREMAVQPPDTSVLVLRNAGKNLTEDDFRRVIPQGKHLEGWTLEQGDILRAIPGRDMATLEPNGDYYLLFSSPLSAFTYQGHVTRIHRVVAANAPSSLLSPIAPPPGYMLEGMDAHEAMNSFTLIAPDQNLQLRQLRPPLAPAVKLLVKHGGYEPLMLRKERMPFEARLTLEGPQLRLPALRHVMRISGKDRGLSWSGDDKDCPVLSEWTPLGPDDMPSMSNNKPSAQKWVEKREGSGYEAQPRTESSATGEDAPAPEELKRRSPHPVYIAGFPNEHALQSFIHFWHQRPMTWEGAGKAGGDEEYDLPPITHVEALW